MFFSMQLLGSLETRDFKFESFQETLGSELKENKQLNTPQPGWYHLIGIAVSQLLQAWRFDRELAKTFVSVRQQIQHTTSTK